MVHTARRLVLEWQAYIVRAAALRRVFVSVKGYYFQVGLMAQGDGDDRMREDSCMPRCLAARPGHSRGWWWCRGLAS